MITLYFGFCIHSMTRSHGHIHREPFSSVGLLSVLISPVVFLLKLTEQFLSILTTWYDDYCYSPLQVFLTPCVAAIPRAVEINGRCYVIFSANIVSWTRTLLVIPTAICLKYNFCVFACLFVLLHDFLDHLDGTVAKVQKSIYGFVDDPMLGAFLDAFCDKIVNILSLWSILLVTDFTMMSKQQCVMYVAVCTVIVAYEFVLGIVRVQDYFYAHYSRKYGDIELADSTNIAANMEGKLKEKLESLGIGCLCLAQASNAPMETTTGVLGITCLLLSICLAHVSLQYKLKARNSVGAEQSEPQGDTSSSDSVGSDAEASLSDFEDSGFSAQMRSCTRLTEGRNRPAIFTSTSHSLWPLSADRVDKVYTVGCFDLFHYGHVYLFQRMRKIGKQIIVGVHDSRSVSQLKGRPPVDGTKTRMTNVKEYADIVYCVHGTDPTPFLHMIFDTTEDCTSLYCRGDDMPNFPGRNLAERLMPILLLPYTKSISSTKIRKDIYNASKFGRIHHN